MKLKFKVQSYQTNAVHSAIDCFAGQPMQLTTAEEEGFKNAPLRLSEKRILSNIQDVQRRQRLPISETMTCFMTTDKNNHTKEMKDSEKQEILAASHIHLNVEMETGTGKTYCYIKTIFEMNKRYGWIKFIIIVPSIAIREGVYKSFEVTADHFSENYGKKVRFFIYNSKRLRELESFSSDAGINVMIINIQAFNASSADNRRIYEELDDFQSRKPMDVIAANHPILILDEPQKMEGKATIKALTKFKPLMVLRYSATHRTQYNLIHRLNALDAYNQKLVKKIAVCGIQTRSFPGASPYIYLEKIEISSKSPIAKLELEVKTKSGEIKRQLRRLKCGSNLFQVSGEMEQYRNGFIIAQIDYNDNKIEFKNGNKLQSGQASCDLTEDDIRRIQIRETIRAHLDKEKQLFSQGIKVLSLFFIDEVAKYRDYDRADEKGKYARVFEEEYERLKEEYLLELSLNHQSYHSYLSKIDVTKAHKGYFSIDKKTKKLKNPKIKGVDSSSNNVDDYDLILKDKELLLSFNEPTRFIFSHSALREGWDNPNVFVICTLKHSNSTISRRQEIGRGLRLSVDQYGNRKDDPTVVHNINILTVISNESYMNFVNELQKEMIETLSFCTLEVTKDSFIVETEEIKVTDSMAKQIYRYLIRNNYIDDKGHVTKDYWNAKESCSLAEIPEDLNLYKDHIFQLIDDVLNDAQFPKIEDSRKSKINPLNSNFKKKEFQELWAQINRKAVYLVQFNSQELINKCVDMLDNNLKVGSLMYTIQTGIQQDRLTTGHLLSKEGFENITATTEHGRHVHSSVTYDLVGTLAENTKLTRRTIANILKKISLFTFEKFQQNPEDFISKTSQIIIDQKSSMVIEHLTYNEVEERYGEDIFTANQIGQDLSKATAKLKKHVYDYAITDSKIERKFIEELDTRNEVIVYAKLPRKFLIPTPIGDYNPDWAISFKSDAVKHIYFVAETKGSLSSLQLRKIEYSKTQCAKRFFNQINQSIAQGRVKYDVVSNYEDLMTIVGKP